MSSEVSAYSTKKLQFLCQLGKGTFGDVYKVRTFDNQIYACKIIEVQNNNTQACKTRTFPLSKIMKEIEILKLCQNNPYVVKYIDHFHQGNYVYILMEYCQNQDLKHFINNHYITEQIARQIIWQLVRGAQSFITLNIVHRDLKLQNILVTKDLIIKICDFGESKLLLSELTGTYVGSHSTMAPQVLACHPSVRQNEKDKTTPTYSNKCDIWSIGVIFYSILFNSLPFKFPCQQSPTQCLKTIKNTGEIKFPSDIPVSEESKEFIRRCLKIDVKQRIDWNQIMYNDLFMEYPSDSQTFQNAQKVGLSQNLKEFYIRSCFFVNILFPINYQHQGSSFKSQEQSAILSQDKLFEFYSNVYTTVRQYIFNKLKFGTSIISDIINHPIVREVFIEQKTERNIPQSLIFEQISRLQQVISYIIIDQTQIQYTTMFQKIKCKQNIFKLPEFDRFIKSSKYKQLLSIFKKEQKEIIDAKAWAIKKLSEKYQKLLMLEKNKELLQQNKTHNLYKIAVQFYNILSKVDQKDNSPEGTVVRMVREMVKFLVNQISKNFHSYQIVQSNQQYNQNLKEEMTNIRYNIDILNYKHKILKCKREEEEKEIKYLQVPSGK